MGKLNEIKVGDVKVSGGIKTTVTDIDPETGQISWDVNYDADYLKLFQEVSNLFKASQKAASSGNAEPFIKDFFEDVRKLRNSLRTYLRNNKAEEYAKIKSMNEMSATGGSANFSSNTGTGAQYATPFAFKKKKKVEESNPGATLGLGPKATENGVKDNAYVKQYKYRLVNKDQLNKQAKGIEVKHLWNK